MLKRPKICGSPSRGPVQFLLLLISGLLNWRGFQSLRGELLGVYVQNDLKWNTHVSSTVSKACKQIHYLRVCRTAHLPRDIGLTTYITILTAYIISPSHGKGLSSSNSSVLYLRASSMMHCGLGFKYRNFTRLVVSSTEFGQVTV